MKFSIGDRVGFVAQSQEILWSLTEKVGTVVGIRQFGPVESMATVRFGGRTVHTSTVNLRLVD